MDIRYKLYPYPVLSNYSDDYINSSFDSAIEVKREGYNIVISVVSEIKNPELEALIKEGKAAFVYHLECAQTGYRTVISTANTDKLVSISEDKVCGRLQICPFIVACADIPDYVNSCFNEDYRGYKFQIEAGCVMAVGKQVNCDIDKERNDLVSAKSIFVVTKNADTTATEMEVDIGQNKIVIKLPENDYVHFKNMSKVPTVQQNLNALIIIPALIYVLSEVNYKTADERYTSYSTYSWYKAIKKAMKKRFQKDIETEDLLSNEIVLYAQRLIKSPLSAALEYLALGCPTLDKGDDGE